MNLFDKGSEESDRNIVQPAKPIPQPFKKAVPLKETPKTAEYLRYTYKDEEQSSKKKYSNHSSSRQATSK
jgi:hypothetical protein